ncbi:MAG: peptide ligase PGM1-related protein, partial [Actinomycetota bacterium]
GHGSESYLSEINLRMGGTTHPFLMARFATQGTYDAPTGRLVAGGRPKYYVASDNLKSEAYVGLEPGRVIAAVAERGLAYDAATKTGAMLHLLGALKHHGKMGTTCVADSRAEADALYEQVLALVDELGERRE